MSVSGFGGSPSIRPSSVASTGDVRSTAGPDRSASYGNVFDSLTDEDRKLIFAATGQYMERGYDGTTHSTSGFALEIASRRAYGLLAPGQEVTAAFLQDVSRQYDAANTGGNPIAPFLDKAVAYLDSRGDRKLDVHA